MINLPKTINYVELYFTLKCNLKCPYCINTFSGIKRNRTEIDIKQLSENLNMIDFTNIPLTIGGGEPTTRTDFYEFVKLLKPEIKIDLLTNLQFNINEFISKISPSIFYSCDNAAYKSIRVSYHPISMDPNDIISRCVALQDAGFSIGLFGINHPLNTKYNIIMSEIARNKKIYFFIKDFLGNYDNNIFGYYKYPESISGVIKSCECKSNELLIGPEGNIYKCHRDLYEDEYPIDNIANKHLQIDSIYRVCNKFGTCNPCDVKLKANRFLEAGKCAVEIKNIKEII
jgi:radical SAM protein with 4Fe4S-binding SPASM domain